MPPWGSAATAASADPIQYRYSTGNRFAIYVQPLTGASGAEVGIRVHYSVGALTDRPGYSAHFVGVCFSPSVYACYATAGHRLPSGVDVTPVSRRSTSASGGHTARPRRVTA